MPARGASMQTSTPIFTLPKSPPKHNKRCRHDQSIFRHASHFANPFTHIVRCRWRCGQFGALFKDGGDHGSKNINSRVSELGIIRRRISPVSALYRHHTHRDGSHSHLSACANCVESLELDRTGSRFLELSIAPFDDNGVAAWLLRCASDPRSSFADDKAGKAPPNCRAR